jgi:hypothetical protein
MAGVRVILPTAGVKHAPEVETKRPDALDCTQVLGVRDGSVIDGELIGTVIGLGRSELAIDLGVKMPVGLNEPETR